MKLVPDSLYNLYRRYFGRYTLDDPRPIAEGAPYTFYLPSTEEIAAVGPGDLVKLLFRGVPNGLEFSVERMWVIVEKRDGESFTGALDNDPSDMPQLLAGDPINFEAHHIIQILWNDPEKGDQFEREEKQVWDRCFVDDCVLYEGVPVEYLYREKPDLGGEEDKYPDSGWRIRGDARDVTDEEMEMRDASYIAIGKVLNEDDSWLHLIESPIGAAFMRNFETGEYEPVDRTVSDV